MRTIRIKLYKFAELNETAKQTVLNNLSDINVRYEWWENMYEDAANVKLKITEFSVESYRWAKGEFVSTAPECLQSEEAIIETINANEYEFTKDGKLS